MPFWKRKPKTAPTTESGPTSPSGDPNWIRIRGINAEAARTAIEDHAGLSDLENPVKQTISLHRLEDDSLAVLATPGLRPIDAMNLCIWMAGVESEVAVEEAVMFHTSPVSGIRFTLLPDNDNPAGDTLLGRNSRSDSVSAYAPEGFLCPVSREVACPEEPDLDPGTPELAFEIPCEPGEENFGNDELLYTDPPNANWHP